MEFMNDKQNTRDVNPAFNAVFDIHVPQEGELVVSECGEDLTPEFSAHRAVRHVVQGIDLPVTEPTRSAPLPEPVSGEPTMQTSTKEADGDPGGYHSGHNLEIANPFADKVPGPLSRELKVFLPTFSEQDFEAAPLLLPHSPSIAKSPIQKYFGIHGLL